jgi:hypothetical protein
MHLQMMKSQSVREQLDAIAAEYEKRTGQRATSVKDLVNAGLLRGLVADPLGFVYEFDADGKAQLNRLSPLFKQKPLLEKPL